MKLRRKTLLAFCLLATTAALIAGCGEHDPGVDEPAREGLAIDVGGVDYNTFITRELNLEIPPDEAFYDGPPAKKGSALFGVFIQVCNRGEEPITPTDDFEVEDNQGNKFEPIELPEDNAFAYNPRELLEDECIPKAGSVAQQGPTTGAMLLFEFPIDNAENRPLELKITPPNGDEPKVVELDL